MNLQTFKQLDRKIAQTIHKIPWQKIDQEKLFAGIVCGVGMGMIATALLIKLLYPTQISSIHTIIIIFGGITMAWGLKL